MWLTDRWVEDYFIMNCCWVVSPSTLERVAFLFLTISCGRTYFFRKWWISDEGLNCIDGVLEKFVYWNSISVLPLELICIIKNRWFQDPNYYGALDGMTCKNWFTKCIPYYFIFSNDIIDDWSISLSSLLYCFDFFAILNATFIASY